MPFTKPIDLSTPKDVRQVAHYLDDPDHPNHVGYLVERLRPSTGESSDRFLKKTLWAVRFLNRERAFFLKPLRRRIIRWWICRFTDGSWLVQLEKTYFETVLAYSLSANGDFACVWHDDQLMGSSDLNIFEPFAQFNFPPRRNEWVDVNEISFARHQADIYAAYLNGMRTATGGDPIEQMADIRAKRRLQTKPDSIEVILAQTAFRTRSSITSKTVLGLLRDSRLSDWGIDLGCWLTKSSAPKRKRRIGPRLWLWRVLADANRELHRLLEASTCKEPYSAGRTPEIQALASSAEVVPHDFDYPFNDLA